MKRQEALGGAGVGASGAGRGRGGGRRAGTERRPAGGVCRVPEGGQPRVSRSRGASLASLGALHQPNGLLKEKERRGWRGRWRAVCRQAPFSHSWRENSFCHGLCILCVCSKRVSAMCVVHTCIHRTYIHMHLYLNARARAHTSVNINHA